LLELKDCNTGLLNDIEFLRRTLTDVARLIGATVIKDDFYQFTPQGVSGVVIIAESHISIHTWPEHNYAAVDVFTCGDVIEPKDAIKPLVEKLQAKSSSFREIKRGILHSEQMVVS
jgi:S-adenosylmethionine decarboxylase proenzyme